VTHSRPEPARLVDPPPGGGSEDRRTAGESSRRRRPGGPRGDYLHAPRCQRRRPQASDITELPERAPDSADDQKASTGSMVRGFGATLTGNWEPSCGWSSYPLSQGGLTPPIHPASTSSGRDSDGSASRCSLPLRDCRTRRPASTHNAEVGVTIAQARRADPLGRKERSNGRGRSCGSR